MKFTLLADLPSDSPASKERADKYLNALFAEQEELAHLSRSQIQKLIESGLILVNQAPVKSKARIPFGASVEVELPEPTELDALPENIPLQILYEDEHLVVINKQPELTVHPSETQRDGTLVNALLYHVKDLSGIGGKLRPGIVHRLDKDTSGAMVATKTDQAHLGLSKQFSAHTIQRKYWALTYGVPRIEGSLRLETTLGRNPKDRKKMAVNVADGRRAVSHFKVLEAYGVPGKTPFSAMVEATLETGRTHQVRAHLNHLGNSLLGDRHYGEVSHGQAKWKSLPIPVQTAVLALPGQALHARILGFKHPITGKELYFEAEPFLKFQTLLNALKEYR